MISADDSHSNLRFVNANGCILSDEFHISLASLLRRVLSEKPDIQIMFRGNLKALKAAKRYLILQILMLGQKSSWPSLLLAILRSVITAIFHENKNIPLNAIHGK